MSINYRAEVWVGKLFGDESDTIAFLDQYNLLDDEAHSSIKEDGLEEYLFGCADLEGSIINRYSGEGFVIGYKIIVSNIEDFANNVQEAYEFWSEIFPENVKPSLLNICFVS